MPRIFFISGLPRAGSTLLSSIINQHPDVTAVTKSGLVETMVGVRNHWERHEEHLAMNADLSREKLKNVLAGVVWGYHNDSNTPVVVDDSRGWLAHIEMVQEVIDDVRILVPVRDIRGVLASMEMLWRKQAGTRQIAQEREYYPRMQSLEGRLSIWMQYDQPVGLACNRVRDALARGHADRLFFVNYDQLIAYPEKGMEAVEDFLLLNRHQYNFDALSGAAQENGAAGAVYGFDGIHDVGQRLRPSRYKWEDVIGQAGEIYRFMNSVWGID